MGVAAPTLSFELLTAGGGPATVAPGTTTPLILQSSLAFTAAPEGSTWARPRPLKRFA